MPMQIGLNELLSMLLARMDGLTMESENQKTRFNIMFRVLYKKGLINDQDVLDAVREEHKILVDLGLLDAMPDEQVVQNTAQGIMLWIKGDTAELKKSMEEYDRQVKDAMAKQQQPKIDVAPAGVLDQLDRISGEGSSRQSGKKLIL